MMVPHRFLASLCVALALAGHRIPAAAVGRPNDKPVPSRESIRDTDKEVSYTTGKTRYQSDFSKDDLDHAPWSLKHGRWHVRDGILTGVSLAEEKHGAALSLMLEVPENQLVSMNFKLAADETFSVTLIGGDGPHGKVVINRQELYIRMKAGGSGDVARILDDAPLDLATATWHQLTFIRYGDRLIATINDEHRIAGRSEKFISPKKRINLVCESTGVRFDNILVQTLAEIKASPGLFSRPSYTLSEFWSMREKQFGLEWPIVSKQDKGRDGSLGN